MTDEYDSGLHISELYRQIDDLEAQRDQLREALLELRRRARIAVRAYFSDDPEEQIPEITARMEELEDELGGQG